MRTPASWLLRFLFLVLVTIVLMFGHAQTLKAASPQGGQCCVCHASNGTTFNVSEQGSCQASCENEGGTPTGATTACFQGRGGNGGSYGYPAAKYNGPTQCLARFDSPGNCNGNNWCHCGVVSVTVVMDKQKEYPAQDSVSREIHVQAGRKLTFHGIVHNFGGTESGPRVALQRSASIEIYGPPSGKLIASFQIAFSDTAQLASYTFDKAGMYRVAVHVWGAYKWNGDDGSCSYECENGPDTLAAVRTDGKNLPLWVIVDANPDKK
jgi:hypothetical protein